MNDMDGCEKFFIVLALIFVLGLLVSQLQGNMHDEAMAKAGLEQHYDVSSYKTIWVKPRQAERP